MKTLFLLALLVGTMEGQVTTITPNSESMNGEATCLILTDRNIDACIAEMKWVGPDRKRLRVVHADPIDAPAIQEDIPFTRDHAVYMPGLDVSELTPFQLEFIARLDCERGQTLKKRPEEKSGPVYDCSGTPIPDERWTCKDKSRILQHDENQPPKFWCHKVQEKP